MARGRRPTQEPLRFDSTDPWGAARIREELSLRVKADGASGNTDPLQQERIDDYVNRLTGIGDWQQDKTMGGSRYGLPFMVRFLASVDIEDRWRGSDVGATVVEKIPEEMTREGWEVVIQPTVKEHDEGLEDPEQEPPIGEQTAPELNKDPAAEREAEQLAENEAEEEGDDTSKVQADAFPPNGPPAQHPPGAPGAPPAPGMMPPPPPKEIPLPEIDDESMKQSKAVMDKLEDLGTNASMLEGLEFERAFGGGAILIGADDGLELDKPLAEDKIKSIDYLTVFQGGLDGEIVAWSYYRDPKSAKYGQPEIYMVRNIGVPTTEGMIGRMGAAPGRQNIQAVFYVHESRLLVFKGKSPSRRCRVQMRGWGDSIFVKVDEVLSQHGQTWGGVTAIMSELKQDVLSVDGAPEKQAADKQSKANPLVKRARTIQQTKSILRMLVIDMNKEKFERMMASLGGVAEVIAQFWLRLAAAAGLPLSLLVGQVKGGLGDAGNTDLRFFYDQVAATQRRVLVPLLKRLVKLIFLSQDGPTGGKEPEQWEVKCRPLYRLDALQEATRRKTIAETDHIYITDGVVNAPEVTASAFGGPEFSAERTIDLVTRRKMALQEKAEREQRMQQAQQRLELAAKGKLPPPGAPGAPPPNHGAPPASGSAPTIEAAKPEAPQKPPSKADEFALIADSLEKLRRAGVVMDAEGVRALFPGFPVKSINEA